MLPSGWYTSMSAFLSHTFPLLPYFFPCRAGLHTLASRSWQWAARTQWHRTTSWTLLVPLRQNADGRETLICMQDWTLSNQIEKQLILIYNSLPMERLWGVKASRYLTSDKNSRHAASGGSYRHRRGSNRRCHHFGVAAKPEEDKVSYPRLRPSPLPDILGKIGTAMSVTQRAQKPPKPSRLCQTHCIHHSWSEPDEFFPPSPLHLRCNQECP